MRLWVALTVLVGVMLGALAARPVHAAAPATVGYQMDKAGTTQPSLANGFFTGQATLTQAADGRVTAVTLHLSRNASLVTALKTASQTATITSTGADTADFTLPVDDAFATARVRVTIQVMGMTQQADLVFDAALAPSTPAVSTHAVAFQLNKHGTTQPSLANGFFTGSATVTATVGQPTTVTLHMAKNGSMLKTFTVGDQAATITPTAAGGADLVLTVDQSFATATVVATMTMVVINMTQQADLVFATPLLPAVAPGTADAAPDEPPSAVTDPAQSAPAATMPVHPTPPPAPGTVGIRVYQSVNGQLTGQPSAAQQFLAQTATTQAHGAETTLTLPTTGALYLRQLRVAGQLAQVTAQHGNAADLVFTLPTAALSRPVPVTFALTLPDGTQMTQPAFFLIDLPVTEAGAVAQPVAAAATVGTGQHVLTAGLATQTVGYTVWNAARSALSTANAYFTHTAQVVQTPSGYKVLLTVTATAGLVQFTPVSVNGASVVATTHRVSAGRDVWQFGFLIQSATALDQPLPMVITMRVPMAGITGQSFTLWLTFTGKGTAAAATATPASASGGLAPIQIAKQPSEPRLRGVQAAQPVKLPALKHYPIVAELGGFGLASLAIIGATGVIKWRQKHGKEGVHDAQNA